MGEQSNTLGCMMDNIRISPEIDKKKIFLINWSDLTDRFNPLFYSISKENYLGKYRSCSLKKIATIQKGDLITSKDVIAGDIPVIAGGQSSPYSHNVANYSGDIITVSASGAYSGYVWYHPYPIFASDCTVISSSSKDILSNKYLFAYLKGLQQFIYNMQHGSGQPHVYPSDLENIKIPIPPEEIQNEIVTKMDAAYASKRQKEAEAQQLLDSINRYVLDELGINLSQTGANTVRNRIFTRQLSAVSDGRLDPFFHLLANNPKSKKYTSHTLKEITILKKGTSITRDRVVDGAIPVIAGGQTSPYSHNIANYNGDVITVSASGAYSGYVWYHPYPIFASDCTVILPISKNTLSNRYLFEYLKTQQHAIYNLQHGSAQPHVYPSDLDSIKIPLPPLKKQEEIANHCTIIRQQAKQLQAEAKKEVEQAKKEVEQIILGTTET